MSADDRSYIHRGVSLLSASEPRRVAAVCRPDTGRLALDKTYRFGLVVVLLVLAVFPLLAHAEVYDDVTVTVTPPEVAVTSHGYVEYPVTVSNRSKTDTHRVTLSIDGGREWGTFAGAAADG